MADKLTIELTLSDLHSLKNSIDIFLAKRTYGFIYANSPTGSNSCPDFFVTLAYMAAHYGNIFKLHGCLRDRLSVCMGLYVEEWICNMHGSCISSMKWKEENNERIMRANARPAVPAVEEEEMPF